MYKTSIITLCYNQLENATKPFIESLYKHTNESSFELIVVNNNSTDGTLEYLHNLNKRNIKIISNSENLGYSKGVNQGLKIANGDFLFVVNNDCLFLDNWLENLIDILEKNKKIGLIAPLTNFCGQPLQLVDNYQKYNTENYYNLFCNINKIIPTLEYTDKIVFFCWGMRKDVFRDVGFLDENFGLAWYEDDDYTLRTIYKKYKVAIAKNTFVFHNHSQTSKQLISSTEGIELGKKNKIYFEKKHEKYFIRKNKRAKIIKNIKIILATIFSVNNEDENKVIKILGIKIKIKKKKKNIARYTISPNVILGGNNIFFDGVKIATDYPDSIIIGKDSFIGENTSISNHEKNSQIIIGNNCRIGFYNNFYGQGGITIGNDVITASYVCILTSNHCYQDINIPIKDQGCMYKSVTIGDNCWIGYNVIILSGVNIGKHVTIGAGSVVTKDLPDFSVCAGNPCKVIKKYNFQTKKWENIK